jgi:hypothetical protein
MDARLEGRPLTEESNQSKMRPFDAASLVDAASRKSRGPCLLSVAELLAEPTPDWIINGMIAPGTLNLVWGHGACQRL